MPVHRHSPAAVPALLVLAGVACAQPFVISNPQRVVGASGACCGFNGDFTYATGSWSRMAIADCAPGGGFGRATQVTQLGGAFVGGNGSASAMAGGSAGCDVQASSSMLVPFDILTSQQVRAIVHLSSAGTLHATADLKVLPLLSVVRSWQSPIDAEESFTLAPGSYRFSVSAGGGTVAPGSLSVATFDVSLEPACYANCDGSTAPPVLNTNDFICFANLWAAGDTHANCDGSTRSPLVNILDFGCFLNRFAAGCP